MVVIAMTSFMNAYTASPAVYSTSVIGVVMMLSRLRLHVSSMKPVVTEIWHWNRTWNSMIPASRYGAAARDASFSCATNAPSEPNSNTSNTGHTAMSNHRLGERQSTNQCRRTTVLMRNQLISVVQFHVAAGQLEEHRLEVG